MRDVLASVIAVMMLCFMVFCMNPACNELNSVHCCGSRDVSADAMFRALTWHVAKSFFISGTLGHTMSVHPKQKPQYTAIKGSVSLSMTPEAKNRPVPAEIC